MDKNTVRGEVTENLPNDLHRVMMDDGKEYICYVAGKMKLNHIKILVGDKVDVILDPYKGRTTNRIVRRVI